MAGSPGQRLAAYLRLARAANVFTAWADVVAAALICGFDPVTDWARLGLLLLASSGLYLGGMVLNDVADYEKDCVERPERPLPAGEVSRAVAARFALMLLGTGLVTAWFVGPTSGTIALALVASIALYDLLLKDTALGPATMGLCRCLNFCLGLSAYPSALWLPTDLTVPLVGRVGTMAAVGLGLYTMSLTRFARREAAGGGRIELMSAVLGMNLGLLMAGFAGLALRATDAGGPIPGPWPWAMYHVAAVQEEHWLLRFAWWAIAITWINVIPLPALLRPTAAHVRRAVRWLIVGIVLYDVAVVSMVRGPAIASVLLPLAVLPGWLSRFLPAT